jgi:hypothetical protein
MSNSKANKFTTQFSCKIQLLENAVQLHNEALELPFFNFDHMNEIELVKKKMKTSTESTFNYPSKYKENFIFFFSPLFNKISPFFSFFFSAQNKAVS